MAEIVFSLSPRRVLPFVVLIGEVVAFHWRILFHSEYVFPWDFRGFHWPLAELQAASLRSGEFPLWDNTSYFGRPLWANIQAQTFYPPRMLTLLLNHLSGGDHVFYLLELQQIAHIALAGVFTYLLLRRLGAREPAALLGATVFQLSGFMASQAQHLGVINGAAWLPLAWLGVVALAGGLTMPRIAVLVLALTMTVLAGLPALVTVAILSTLLLALGLVLLRLAPFRLFAATLGGVVWALLLSAVQLLPTLQLNFHSIAQYRADWRAAGGGIPLQSLVSLLIPNYYGVFDLQTYTAPWNPTFLYLYSGLAALGLAVAAALYRKHRNGLLYALLTVATGLVMLGDATPLGRAAYQLLPARVQAGVQPEFMTPSFALGLAVLAGLGAHWYLRRPALQWAAVLVVACDLVAVSSNRPFNTAHTPAEPGVTRTAFDGSEELLSRMRGLVNQTSPPYRTDTVDDSITWPMTAPLTGLPTGSGYDPMAPERVIRARLAFCEGERWGATYHVRSLASAALPALNIRYLLNRSRLPDSALEGSGYRHLSELPNHHVYENPDTLPRFYLVSKLRTATGLEDAARQFAGPDFDPRTEAIVEGDPVQALSRDATPGTAAISAYTPNHVELTVNTPADAYLVSSETHYPGWRAFIDGEPAPLHYTNVAFRGLYVPAGTHTVTMEFRPGIFWWGLALGALAAAALLGLLIRFRRQPGDP